MTTFAELKRPPPPPRKEDNSKPKSFGFSLLRNKSANHTTFSTSSSDHRNNNISRTQSFLSVPYQEKNFSTLPINIRRSPSPKSYQAPPIPTMAQPNYMKDKNMNNSTMTRMSPRSNAKINGEKFNFEGMTGQSIIFNCNEIDLLQIFICKIILSLLKLQREFYSRMMLLIWMMKSLWHWVEIVLNQQQDSLPLIHPGRV